MAEHTPRQVRRKSARYKYDKQRKLKQMELTVTVRDCVELYNSSVAGIKFSNPSTIIAIAQIIHAVRPIAESYETQRKALLEKHGKIDDNGELVTKDREILFPTPVARKTFELDHKEILNTTTVVTVPKIDGEKINGEGLTPIALLVLIPFGLKLPETPEPPPN